MKNLSIQEQKQVVGGQYRVKVFSRSTGKYLWDQYFDNYDDAKDYRTQWTTSAYSAYII